MENNHPFASENGETYYLLQNVFENLSVGLELYDRDGLMTEINRTEMESMGIRDKKEVLGLCLFDNPNVSDDIKDRIRAGGRVQYVIEYNFDEALAFFPTYLSGINFFEVTAFPLHNEKGSIIKYLVVTQDITEKVKAEQKVQQSKQEMELALKVLSKKNTELRKRKELQEKILNSMPLPIHIKDVEDDFRYVFCNDESKRMFGSAVFNSAYEVMSKQQADKLHETDRQVYATGKPYFGQEKIVLKDGRVYETIVQKSIIEDEGRRLLLNVRWDKSLQNELERRAKVLSISLDALEAYTWHYDIDNDLLTFGDGFEKIGRGSESLNTFEKFVACIHPDDRQLFISKVDSILLSQNEIFSMEYRIDLSGNGLYNWWECRGAIETVVIDTIPTRFVFGMDINIEVHKNTEMTLLRNKEEMTQLIRQNELVLNNANSGLAFISTDYIVQWENVSVCSTSLSYEAYKKGELCYKSAHNRDTPCENCVLRRTVKSGQVEEITFNLQNERIVQVFATPVFNTQEEIEGIVIRVDDITERQRMIAALEKAKRQAEESDKLKSAFLANMSHEIRTPLNAIVGFSDLLMTAEDEEDKKEYIRIINTNNELLLKLINDILDLSKIEAGSVDLKYEKFDLSVYFDELVTSMQGRAKNPNVRLLSINPYASCMVRLDKNRLAQILTNYVTNSLKYTSKGFVEMGYEEVGEGIRLYVRDTGIGISEEKKSKVFHRFEKLDEFAQGTGLGLSICRAIVEACGGSVGFESEHGQGSLFWAVLPCDVEVRNDKEIVLNSNSKVATAKINVTEKAGDKQKTILVAEDIQSNYLLVSALLKKKYNLLHALNGKEAIEIAKTQPVDLILMDMKMPVIDGLTAIAEIRKFNTRIPIVALTAHAFETDRIAAIEAGCNGYLVKPIDKAKLMSVLREHCS